MPLILNIDTATETASICLSNDEEILAIEKNIEQKNHGSFLQPAIKQMLLKAEKTLDNLDAIAVTEGPGSYTGLRVGLASAKGLCYAANKPLILVNTLEVMAMASIKSFKDTKLQNSNILFCPMIDARRMEVFTAVYDFNLNCVMQPCAMVLDANSFNEILTTHQVIFTGNGHAKFKNIAINTNAIFSDIEQNGVHLSMLSTIFFKQKKFSNLAYSEPFYLKEFFNPPKKDKI